MKVEKKEEKEEKGIIKLFLLYFGYSIVHQLFIEHLASRGGLLLIYMHGWYCYIIAAHTTTISFPAPLKYDFIFIYILLKTINLVVYINKNIGPKNFVFFDLC